MRKGQFKLLKLVKIELDGGSTVALVPVKIEDGVEIDSTAAAEAYLRSGKAKVEGVIAIVDFKKRVKVGVETKTVVNLTSVDEPPAAKPKKERKAAPKAQPEPPKPPTSDEGDGATGEGDI